LVLWAGSFYNVLDWQSFSNLWLQVIAGEDSSSQAGSPKSCSFIVTLSFSKFLGSHIAFPRTGSPLSHPIFSNAFPRFVLL